MSALDVHPDCDYCQAFPDLPCATHRLAGEESRRRTRAIYGYYRDRSWYASRPNMSAVTKVHRLGPDGLMAACNSHKIMLDVEGGHVIVAEHPRACAESALCRRCWPDGRPSWDDVNR